MKLILINNKNNYFESIYLNVSKSNHDLFEKLKNDLKLPIKCILIIYDEKISCSDLNNLKNILTKLKIKDFQIYSNSREIILTGKSLKINSTLIKNPRDCEEELTLNSINNCNKSEDNIYKGTVRSGNRISSNGDLYVIGDVNPGAIVSATNNIYVWGKLLGIAAAGKDGNNKSSIASLYLNPLQLRISNIIAIGPKEKPKNQYPEIAVVENQLIVIKPYKIKDEIK